MRPGTRSPHELPATGLAALLGLAWGLFWIPMREIDAAGVNGPWATLALYLVIGAAALPLWLWRGRPMQGADRWLVGLAGIAGGLSLCLYATSFLYTDVIRAILLYYMTPVWSAVMERLFFRTPLGPARLAALACGLGGLSLVLGLDGGLPMPRNAGDWMALMGGIFWSLTSVGLYRARRPDAVSYAAWYAVGALAFALPFALLPGPQTVPLPEASALLPALPWLLFLGWGLMLSSTLVVPWLTRHAGPTRTGLMYMLETPVAGLTAALLTSEIIGWQEIVGAALIMLAGVLDTVWGHVRVAAPGEVEFERP